MPPWDMIIGLTLLAVTRVEHKIRLGRGQLR